MDYSLATQLQDLLIVTGEDAESAACLLAGGLHGGHLHTLHLSPHEVLLHFMQC